MQEYSDEINASEEFNIIQEEDSNVEYDEPVQEENSNVEYDEPVQEENSNVEYDEPVQEEQPKTIESTAVKSDFVQPEFVNVKIKFPNSATPIDCVSGATNCREKIVAANKQIRLLQNRFYFIPVDTDARISSDNYGSIKIYSTQADKIDVRYVKNGFACLISLKHNVKLYDDELLAVLY